MKSRRKVKKDIKEMRAIISAYLNTPDDEGKYHLRKLDVEEEGDYAYKRNYYTGVRASYISRYLLKNKYDINLVAYVLLMMTEDETIAMLRCPDIDDLVFKGYKGKYHRYALREINRYGRPSVENHNKIHYYYENYVYTAKRYKLKLN